jgi:Flp pilus assembly protein TadG
VNRPHLERGSMTGFVAVIATALVMVAGMAYDGGALLNSHATARRAAAEAARAGAQQVDIGHLRTTGEIRLERDAAETAATAFLDAAGVDGTAQVDGAEITVTATIRHDLVILPGADRTVTAVQSATAIDGGQP